MAASGIGVTVSFTGTVSGLASLMYMVSGIGVE